MITKKYLGKTHFPRFRKISVGLLGLMLIFVSCQKRNTEADLTGELSFVSFEQPPAEARPFVRWWWNGNHLEKEEIARQLDVLHQAGVGGVEINPIAMPEDAADIGTKSITWLSPEWNDMLVFATEEAKKRGMIADLIVGSGWPFGGEFLKEEEAIQRIIVNRIPCSGGQVLREDPDGLYRKAVASLSRSHEAAKSHELVFIRLVPVQAGSVEEITDLTGDFRTKQKLDFTVPPGEYELVYGILQRSNREVMHGAPGAAGPVMNHYKKEITRAYLNRLKKISEDTGKPLSELIRALFCDSIELDGSNWTDGLGDIFYETYGYRIEPWFPFVFYNPYTGYGDDHFSDGFGDQVNRVRFDYNQLLVDVFLDNFTQEFQNFCTENGVLCRYQAYGTPFLMGLTEGNMIADIPESNNWIYSTDMDADAWYWNQGHGYMIWNMYAASGGHLTGKKIVSNEAMTNTRGVFKASLEEIKQHDDMNFITGMNHAVLHGYNYSPPEAGFPGWVRYGAYFNEKNTWWPFFRKWADYNARLSWVFQNSQPVKTIAILAPEADLWTQHGLTRNQFHTQPWYVHRLWEPIIQTGSSCDYVSQKVIARSQTDGGKLSYGPMSYDAVFLGNVESMVPQAARVLLDFVKQGGTLVAIGSVPKRSPSFRDADVNDSLVVSFFDQIQRDFPDRFFVINPPEKEEELLSWTNALFEKTAIPKDLGISDPVNHVWQIHKRAGDKEVWFFANSHRNNPAVFTASFPTGEKTPWIWNPEEGTRKVFPYGRDKDKLTIKLAPLQSLLLVFEPDDVKAPESPENSEVKQVMALKGPWEAVFQPVYGGPFSQTFTNLSEFGTSEDPRLNGFAGTVIYTTTFESSGEGEWLDLGKTNKGVVEVFLNGKPAGISWYGKPVFNIAHALVKGDNRLEIKYTSVLSNYVTTLTDNPTARKWTQGYTKIPNGLEGVPVILTGNNNLPGSGDSLHPE